MITIRLFAQARELAGHDELTMELPHDSTASAVRRALARSHPGLAPLLDGMALAVNRVYVRDNHIIRPGDEVALIPPVAGG